MKKAVLMLLGANVDKTGLIPKVLESMNIPDKFLCLTRPRRFGKSTNVSIPNHELMLKFEDVLSKEGVSYIAKLTKHSKETLAATLRGDEEMVARAFDEVILDAEQNL